jgi:aminoglycoside phosphotransferase (APT) family kinase protein
MRYIEALSQNLNSSRTATAQREFIVSSDFTPPAGASAVRTEDAFDVAAVLNWLKDQGIELKLADSSDAVVQFRGGASNLTYLLRCTSAGAPRDVVLRRPPHGTKAKSAHDMTREFTIQSHLAGAYPFVPNMVALCTDESIIGSDFYVMDYVPGVILRKDLPDDWHLTPAEARTLCTSALDRLIELHAIDPEAVGVAELGRGPGYVARQVKGWSERYERAHTPNAPDYLEVREWLAANQPDDSGACVIHNDFRFDNMVLNAADPHEVLGILDWEMATVGDPLMDLGGSLAYWAQADDDEFFQSFRRQPTTAPGMLTRAEVVDYYAEATGRTITPQAWRFYEVFGLFRLAVIAQQIYYRFHHGQTTNPDYAAFLPAVTYLETRCREIIAGNPT